MSDVEKTIEAVRTDPNQLGECWAASNAQEQIELLKGVVLSQEHITHYWDNIGDDGDKNQFRFLCCKHQQIDPTFLEEHWGDLEVDAKYAAMLSQDQLPAGLVKDFWQGLSSQTEDDSIVKAFAGTVRPERQPERYMPSE